MNKTIFTTVLALFLGVIIGGSTAVAKIKLNINNERPTMKHVDKIEYYGHLSGRSGIYYTEIKGVPCFLYTGYGYGSAISCDWSKK